MPSASDISCIEHDLDAKADAGIQRVHGQPGARPQRGFVAAPRCRRCRGTARPAGGSSIPWAPRCGSRRCGLRPAGPGASSRPRAVCTAARPVPAASGQARIQPGASARGARQVDAAAWPAPTSRAAKRVAALWPSRAISAATSGCACSRASAPVSTGRPPQVGACANSGSCCSAGTTADHQASSSRPGIRAVSLRPRPGAVAASRASARAGSVAATCRARRRRRPPRCVPARPRAVAVDMLACDRAQRVGGRGQRGLGCRRAGPSGRDGLRHGGPRRAPPLRPAAAATANAGRRSAAATVFPAAPPAPPPAR